MIEETAGDVCDRPLRLPDSLLKAERTICASPLTRAGGGAPDARRDRARARRVRRRRVEPRFGIGCTYAQTPYEACAGADALVVANNDRAYTQLDWARIAELLRGKHVLDLRNRLDAAAVRRTGLSYRGVGPTRGRLVAS